MSLGYVEDRHSSYVIKLSLVYRKNVIQKEEEKKETAETGGNKERDEFKKEGRKE
jgi:hypothetical protein